MNEFLTGKSLEDAIYNIIWEVEETLLIVSPFIKLDNYFKELFDKHQNNPNIHLVLVFGKNEKEIKRSLSESDLGYFKKFPNTSIIYVPNLHAKYYGNEKKGVVTSINLYDYSFKNNIEFGIFSQHSLLSSIRHSADNDAWSECMRIAEENEVVFIKRPVYENRKLIVNIGKKYVKSDVIFDCTENLYGISKSKSKSKKRLNDFPDELIVGAETNERPQRENEEQSYGYCIRTGIKIKFNPKQPMCKESWQSWNKYKNMDFPEKFCHKTGKPSNGRTTMRNPIL